MKLSDRILDIPGNFVTQSFGQVPKSGLQSPYQERVVTELFPPRSESPTSGTKVNFLPDLDNHTLRQTVDSKMSFERHPLLVQSYKRQTAITSSLTDLSKESRLNTLRTKMDEIAGSLAAKRNLTIKDRIGRVSHMLEAKFKVLKTGAIKTLIVELAKQSTQDLYDRRVLPNYGTLQQLLKRQTPAALTKAEHLLRKHIAKNAITTLRERAAAKHLSRLARSRLLSSCLSALKQSAAEHKHTKTKDKLTEFLLKLDTYLLLLKYNSFFDLMAAHAR